MSERRTLAEIIDDATADVERVGVVRPHFTTGQPTTDPEILELAASIERELLFGSVGSPHESGVAASLSTSENEETAMTVTARFYVRSIEYNQPHEVDAAKVILAPAYNNGSGNEAWSKATPSGEITLQISNPSAVGFFDGVRRANQNLHIEFSIAP